MMFNPREGAHRRAAYALAFLHVAARTAFWSAVFYVAVHFIVKHW